MNVFETSATVGNQGDVHLVGVPFEPGTEVEVVVSTRQANGVSAADAHQRLTSLFAALDRARNTEPVGSLDRNELYDRDTLR